LLKDLEAASGLQEKELRRNSADLEQSKRDLEKMRKEALIKLEDLRRLEGGN